MFLLFDLTIAVSIATEAKVDVAGELELELELELEFERRSDWIERDWRWFEWRFNVLRVGESSETWEESWGLRSEVMFCSMHDNIADYNYCLL